MLRFRTWSPLDVGVALLASARGTPTKRWVAAYLLARRGPEFVRQALRRLAPADTPLSLRGLAAPLRLSADVGGLATYYEIVVERIYAPRPEFEPCAGATVVDVGANIGVFSSWAAARVGPGGRLLSVEPHPLAFERLVENVEPFGASVSARRFACGQQDGQVDLRYVPGRLSVSSIKPRADRTRSVRVPVRRLDQLVAEAGLDQIDLMKIDVEGAEQEVLEGAGGILPSVRRVVMEVDSDRIDGVEQTLGDFGLRRAERRSGMWGLPQATIICLERSDAVR